MRTQKKDPAQKMRVAITGAAGGLGKAFAVECASRGWNLFLTDARAGALETLAEGLRSAYGVDVACLACDLSNPDERARLFEELKADGLHFTMLINVAGVDFEGPFYERSDEQIRTIIRLNVEGTLAMTHGMLAFREPLAAFRIINVASLAAFYPMPVKATYAASKRFLLDFSLALREEIRSQNASVTVLCPAGMPTNAECIRAIEAQGLAGLLTTLDVGRVANQTIEGVLAGRAVVIPGAINRVLQTLGSLAPAGLVAGLISSRWSAVRQKRESEANPA